VSGRFLRIQVKLFGLVRCRVRSKKKAPTPLQRPRPGLAIGLGFSLISTDDADDLFLCQFGSIRRLALRMSSKVLIIKNRKDQQPIHKIPKGRPIRSPHRRGRAPLFFILEARTVALYAGCDVDGDYDKDLRSTKMRLRGQFAQHHRLDYATGDD